MGIYTQIYYTICNRGKQMQEHYCKESGLHRHHIVPKHSNGSDDEDNITYLTVREHKIAHFLLWKMHGNALDLGAMWMLSGKLSPQKEKNWVTGVTLTK